MIRLLILIVSAYSRKSQISIPVHFRTNDINKRVNLDAPIFTLLKFIILFSLQKHNLIAVLLESGGCSGG